MEWESLLFVSFQVIKNSVHLTNSTEQWSQNWAKHAFLRELVFLHRTRMQDGLVFDSGFWSLAILIRDNCPQWCTALLYLLCLNRTQQSSQSWSVVILSLQSNFSVEQGPTNAYGPDVKEMGRWRSDKSQIQRGSPQTQYQCSRQSLICIMRRLRRVHFQLIRIQN